MPFQCSRLVGLICIVYRDDKYTDGSCGPPSRELRVRSLPLGFRAVWARGLLLSTADSQCRESGTGSKLVRSNTSSPQSTAPGRIRRTWLLRAFREPESN